MFSKNAMPIIIPKAVEANLNLKIVEAKRNEKIGIPHPLCTKQL